MESVIIDKCALPELITSYIHSEKVRLFEENGNVILSPVGGEYSILEKSFGLFSDGKLSVERFMENKKREKALEI